MIGGGFCAVLPEAERGFSDTAKEEGMLLVDVGVIESIVIERTS